MGILALLSPIGKLLGDWRAIVTIIIAIILIVCGLKVQHTYKELKNTKATLETTLTINKTLNDEIAKAKKVNDENELIIKQIQADKKLSSTTVAQLAKNLADSSKSFNELNKSIEDFKYISDSKDPAEVQIQQKVPDVILSTIDKIQKLRGDTK
jgi:uncharacterized protein YoxC